MADTNKRNEKELYFTMNIFNYAVRYLWVLACTNYQENYWDQVKENEKWFKVVEKILMKGKEE